MIINCMLNTLNVALGLSNRISGTCNVYWGSPDGQIKSRSNFAMAKNLETLSN